MSLFLLLAAGSLPTLISGAPLPTSLFGRASNLLTGLTEKRSAGFGDVYTQYTGSGEQGWPSIDHWIDFDSLFSQSKSVMSQSCTQFGATNPSDSEINNIKSGVKTVAGESGLDARFIFAILMQESNGCVRAPTTNYGVRNPGLMQDHNGAASCNDGHEVNPCPASTITQMIRDGVMGTPSGDGLKQCLAQAGASGAAGYYRAARIYNSGSISGNDLSAGVATHCYSSDLANRLTGWIHGTHGCNLDGASVPVNTVMPTTGGTSTVNPPETLPKTSPKASPKVSEPFVSHQEAPKKVTKQPIVEQPHIAQINEDAPKPPPAATTEGTLNAEKPAQPATTKAPGVTDNCKQYYTVVDGDNCWALGEKYGFTLAQFQGWNTQIDGGCSNLWKGYSYCVKQ